MFIYSTQGNLIVTIIRLAMEYILNFCQQITRSSENLHSNPIGSCEGLLQDGQVRRFSRPLRCHLKPLIRPTFLPHKRIMVYIECASTPAHFEYNTQIR